MCAVNPEHIVRKGEKKMIIKLKRMILENFMYYMAVMLDFPQIAKILAKNGKGKSSIVNAFMWCLFDCDYELRSNPKVRREVDGNSVEDKDVSVELVLDVDGKEVKMRKVQKRKYSKDGTTYKDNNEYYINDVPKTKKDFEEYLGIDMSVLKMSTNINGFLNQKPADMRDFLFKTADSMSDWDIAKKTDGLQELSAFLENYTTEEIKAMNQKKVKDVDESLPILKGQIEEKQRDIVSKQETDVSDLELLKKDLQSKLDANIKVQTDNDKLIAEFDDAVKDVMDLKFELSGMEQKANLEIATKRNGLANKKDEIFGKIGRCKGELARLSSDLALQTKLIADNKQKKDEQATLWKIANERKFDESSLVCSYCGQEYPEEKKEELRAEFESHKADELKQIVDRGNALKKAIDDSKILLKNLEENIQKKNAESKKLTAEYDSIEKELESIKPIDVKQSEKYKDIESKIADREDSMKKMQDLKDIKAELKKEEERIRSELAETDRKIFAANTESDEIRLEELKKSKFDKEQEKADAEKILNLLKELEKAKNEELSEEINSKFGIVNWQLFETAKNGNYKSVCVPMIDGKSILTTMSNKGNRILGRVDICRSIQKISGINCPIWLDDLESLDSENQKKVSEMVESQLIMLAVSNNAELEIKNLESEE